MMHKPQPMRMALHKFSWIILSQLLLISAAAAAAPHLVVGCTIPCGDMVTQRVQHAAEGRGVTVEFIDLSQAQNKAELREALARVDAVISPGGDDINPHHYLEAVAPTDRAKVLEMDARLAQHPAETLGRDAFELEVRRLYFSDEHFRELPFLGICYGMQMLAVSQGLPLVVDIQAEFGIPNRYNVTDDAWFDRDSLAASVVGASDITATESHHQAVDLRAFARIAPGAVFVTGLSNGGRIPEAIEFESRPLALGVQFHPEASAVEVSDRMFGWLLDRARQRIDLETQRARSQAMRRRACERFLLGSSN